MFAFPRLQHRAWVAPVARLLLGLLLVNILALSAWAQSGVLDVPVLTAHVMDSTNTLDAAQRQALQAKLAAFEQERGAQVVILLVPTTQPEDIAAYAQRVGDAWKIGRKNIGDGLLLVVAKNDRKVRIETTKALEGALPDLAAQQIIDNAITPRFKQGDFAGGLEAGADQIMARIKGENLPAPAGTDLSQVHYSQGFQWLAKFGSGVNLAILLLFALPLGARLMGSLLGRKLGTIATGGLTGLLAWVFTSSLGLAGLAGMAGGLYALFSSLRRTSAGSISSASWGTMGGFGSGGGSSWGSSGGSGGFNSGGGGNFGGGGASGDW